MYNQHLITIRQPRFKSKKLIYFDELVSIVGHIDFDKNVGGSNILELAGQGIKLILEMSVQLLDTGGLQDTFECIKNNHQRPELLVDLINAAHDEISILLGDEEWCIYYPD